MGLLYSTGYDSSIKLINYSARGNISNRYKLSLIIRIKYKAIGITDRIKYIISTSLYLK